MKKIDKVFTDYEKKQAELSKLINEREELKRVMDNLANDAEKTANDGNIDEYVLLTSQLREGADRLHVYDVVINKGGTIDKESAVAAWNEYTKSQEAELQKLLDAYQSKRFVAEQSLLSLLNGIEAMYNKRDQLVKITEAKANDSGVYFIDGESATSVFPVNTFDDYRLDNDITFYERTGLIDNKTATQYRGMLIFAKSNVSPK